MSSEVDVQFDSVAQRLETGHGVFPVQSEVEREVVACAGTDHQERNPLFRSHSRDQSLGAVATGNTEQIGSPRHRPARERLDIDEFGPVEYYDLGTEFLGTSSQVETNDFATTGVRVHHEERPVHSLRGVFGHRGFGSTDPQCGAGRSECREHESHLERNHPQLAFSHDYDQHDDRSAQRRHQRRQPENTTPREKPVHRSDGHHHGRDARHREQHCPAQARNHDRYDQGRREKNPGEACPPQCETVVGLVHRCGHRRVPGARSAVTETVRLNRPDAPTHTYAGSRWRLPR